MRTIFWFFIIIFNIILIYSCSLKTKRQKINEVIYPTYVVAYSEEVPDSLKDNFARWVTETMRVSCQNMKTNENSDDLLEETYDTGEKIFSRRLPGMYKVECENCYASFVRIENFTAKEKEIYIKLKNE